MTSCNHSSLHPNIRKAHAVKVIVRGINRRGGGSLFCDFVSTKWSAFVLLLIETILFFFFFCHTALQSYKGILEYCRLTHNPTIS